jgi:hypothetical protein
MKYVLAILAFLFCGAAQAQDALVVATCGTLPLAYAPGATRLLTVDTTGKLCGTGGGGAGNPGGSNTQVQYNNAGSFGGITGATTNGTTLTLVAPVLGTPASGVATNLTGTAAGLTAGNVTGGAIQPLSGTSATVAAMSAGAAMSDTDLVYCAQSAGTTDRKCTGAQAKTYVNTSAVRATTTTSEAVANSDQNKLVTFSNAAAVACTIAQAGSGGNFVAGWAVSLRNLGAGTVTCTATTSSVDGGGAGGSFILLPGQGLDLYSDGTNYFTQGGRGTIVAKGVLALATSAISSAACTSAQTLTATGVVTTDIVLGSFNGDPTAVTGYVPLTAGMLTIVMYPTANTINVKVCNNTSSSITPGAITLNLSAVR